MFKFARKKKGEDAAPFLRRIIDRSISTSSLHQDNRLENRYNRTFSLMFAPWCPKNGPDIENIGVGITKDLSDHGCSFLSLQEITGDVVMTFLLDDEIASKILCFHGELRRERVLLKGLYEYGFEISSVLSSKHSSQLVEFVMAVDQAFNDNEIS